MYFGGHLIFMNIPPRIGEGYYTSVKSPRDLTPTWRPKIPPSLEK
jgi:hypothetical protein